MVVCTSVGQPQSLIRDPTIVVPVGSTEGVDDEVEPLVVAEDEQQQQSVPVSEMHAISLLGALRIPVSHLNSINNVMCDECLHCGSDRVTHAIERLPVLLPVTVLGKLLLY